MTKPAAQLKADIEKAMRVAKRVRVRVRGSHGDLGRVIMIDVKRDVAVVKWDGHAAPTLCPVDQLTRSR